jgi:hypothetical protein
VENTNKMGCNARKTNKQINRHRNIGNSSFHRTNGAFYTRNEGDLFSEMSSIQSGTIKVGKSSQTQ